MAPVGFHWMYIMKSNGKVNNAKVKRLYILYLKEVKGLADATLRIKEDFLHEYEEFIKGKDFKCFSKDLAVEYKNHLKKYTKLNGEKLSIHTIKNKINTIKDFFQFLIREPGYRRHIKENEIQYLTLDRGVLNAINTSRNLKLVPDYNEVEKLIMSISTTDEQGKRDKGMESLLALTAIRLGTLISLRMGSFNKNNLTLTLDTVNAIRTKGQKSFIVKFIVFNDIILQSFLDYYSFLELDKHFTINDPLFPKTKLINKKGNFTFNTDGLTKEFYKTIGPIEKIHKQRCNEAGIEYFNPHIYRDIIVQHARKFCKNLDEYAAVSQNVGHSSLATTDINYGQINPDRRMGILNNIDFKSYNRSELITNEKIFEEIKKIKDEVRKLKKSNE